MDIQSITVVIAGISVIVGVINSILSSRRAEEQRQLSLETQQLTLETRQAQLFAQVYNRWSQRDTVKAYGVVRYKHKWTDLKDWLSKYGADVDPEAYADAMTLNSFFEGLGVLVKKGLIDIELVEDLFSQRIIWYWEEMHLKSIHDVREFTNDPTQYDSIEYLYNVMKQRQQATVST